MQIEVEVKGQRIKRINSPGSVEDTLNYLTCHFIFSGEEWDNTVKTAYFENPASGKRHPKILADDGTCTVPWEALTDKGFVRFSVAGERDGYRITTGIESFYNSETVYGGNPSEPPTPDQYDQLIALAEQTKEIAESVREDADAGEFDGPPGPQGPKGENGDTGPRGPAGKDGQNATDEQVRAAVEAYMEEHPIQADTEDIIKLAIKNEASGAVPISITDSADMGVQELEMQGWTEQAQYEGKNLFDISAVVLQHDGDTVHVTPENPETSILQSALPGQYTISFRDHKIIEHSPSGDVWTCNFVFYYTDGSKGEMYTYAGTKFTSDAKKTVSSIALRNPWKVVEDISGIMINAGAEPLSYEPYTGGKPSPNPDYKQDVKNAGKYDEETQKWKYEVKLTGKNLIPTYSEYSDWMAADYKYIPVSGFMIGETYTFSQSVVPELGEGVYVALGTVAGTVNTGTVYWIYHSAAQNLCVKSITFVATQETYYLNAAGFGSTNMSRFLSVFPDLMVELGTERTEYEPYKEQTVTLTSDRPLTKWDKLEKRGGVWGWVYKSAEVVLDGSEYWMLYTNNKSENLYGFQHNISNLVMKNTSEERGFIDKIPSISQGISSTNKMAAQFGYLNTTLYILLPREYFSEHSVSALTEWLSENPLMVLYETAEETFVPLAASEQEALNALHTYYPTTMLSNDAGCEMTIKYIADTKAYIDSKIAAIHAAVVNRI